MAEELKCKSVAIPAISSGIYGFPKPLCAKTFFAAIEEYAFQAQNGHLQEVRLCNFDDETCEVFHQEFDTIFNTIGGTDSPDWVEPPTVVEEV